jgi:6-phospho-beta-glucosidase
VEAAEGTSVITKPEGKMPARPLKVCVIGGGSTYTPELIDGLIDLGRSLSIEEVVLMDIDAGRLETLGALARRMVAASDREMAVRTTCDRLNALRDADYVVTQIRVGGTKARIQDERIPLRHGVIGQETTGPGGFANALRTVPVMLDIAADTARVAPRARLINFTNPSGIVTEALAKHSGVTPIGLCNGPIGAQRAIAELLDTNPGRISMDWVGLNHLSWVRGVTLDGRELIGDVIERAISSGLVAQFSPALLRGLRMLPSYYLDYYYNTKRVLSEQRAAERTRGEEVLEIEQRLLDDYSDPALATKPADLGKRGGAYYSTAAVSLIRALEGEGGIHIVNVPNCGAIAELPGNVAVEVPCSIESGTVRPLPCSPLPATIRGLVQSVKSYEELTIQASVEGDDVAAVLALNAHPLVPDFEVAEKIWEDIKRVHARYLPQFA